MVLQSLLKLLRKNNNNSMAFFESSKIVADRFLQNIVFVDERAYVENDGNQQHSFNAKAVSDAFASKQKLCTVFAPSSQEEVEQSLPMLLKADVVVLDRNLDFENIGAPDQEEAADDDAEDADQDDSRGQHTLNLISQIVEDAGQDKVRIIVVYTGETDLDKITREIHSSLSDKGFEQARCKVSSSNVCILVRAKRNGEEAQYQHLPELQAMVCGYDELPDLILNEFSKMVYGLLPNYALNAMTTIRESTSKILRVFSKDMDAAYLGHQVAIPNKEDAPRLLAEVFGTSVKELLEDSQLIEEKWVDEWIDEQVVDNARQIKVKKDKSLTAEIVHRFWQSNQKDLNEKFNEAFGEKVTPKTAVSDRVTEVFADEAETRNKRFAELTQMRNSFGPATTPKKLNQGTIVESSGSYYVSIQPRCDALRIESREEGQQAERQFLFLPLQEDGKGPAVIVDDKILRVDNKSYHIKIFVFSPDEESHDIFFRKEGERFVISDEQGADFVWKGELKELQAQRISTAYSSELSRVGLDESEWLRVKGK